MSSISLFKHAKDNESKKTITIVDFLNSIKFGEWKDVVNTVREEPVKEKRRALKEKVPCVTLSGIFQKRNEHKLISHSGFICIDVDDYTDKSGIIDDKYTYACFDSVSATGFAVLVKVNPSKHKDSFRWLQKYYFETYGIVIDPAPQNVASLRYVSYDANLEINEKSKLALTLTIPKKQPVSLPIILSDNEVGAYVQEVVSRGIILAHDYDDYITLAFSLASGFGETGRSYFHSLTHAHEKYDSKHADKQYTIALKDKGQPEKKASIGTFYYLLKQAGIEVKPTNNRAVQIAAIAKKSGRTKEGVTKQLIEINGVKEDTAKALVDEVFSRNDISLKTISADPERLIESLSEWMIQNFSIKKNSITRKLEIDGFELSEEKLNTIFLQARSAFNTPNVNFDLINRIVRSELIPVFNPFDEYVKLNSWRSSAGNIHKICCSINSDTPMGGIWVQKWMLGIIAAFKGYPVRYMLTFLGKQFTGKTEWFRRFLPAALKKYYGESHFDRGKDDEIMMCQKIIILDDEMGGKSKSDEKLLKELTSKDVFTLRVPYGRGNEDMKRLAILCGTSNDQHVINDRTGNTRILPIEINSIDFEVYNSVDKDELFMELYRVFESGAEWQLSKSDFEALTETGKNFETINFERELILKFFTPTTEKGLVERMTATDIKNHIETHSRQQIKSMSHFGRELSGVFGRSKQSKNDGKFLYSVIKIPLA